MMDTSGPIINTDTDGPVVGGGGDNNVEELTRQQSIWDYWAD